MSFYKTHPPRRMPHRGTWAPPHPNVTTQTASSTSLKAAKQYAKQVIGKSHDPNLNASQRSLKAAKQYAKQVIGKRHDPNLNASQRVHILRHDSQNMAKPRLPVAKLTVSEWDDGAGPSGSDGGAARY